MSGSISVLSKIIINNEVELVVGSVELLKLCKTFNSSKSSQKDSEVVKMIVILQKYQILLKILGLDPRGGRMNIYKRIYFLILSTSIVLLPMNSLITNIQVDIKVALASIPPIFGLGVVMPLYIHLVMNRKRIHSLLDELQDIVTESM